HRTDVLHLRRPRMPRLRPCPRQARVRGARPRGTLAGDIPDAARSGCSDYGNQGLNMRSAAERRVERNSERPRNNREFRRAGEAWLRACLEGPHIHSAKTLATYLFLHFNYQRWRETGVLDAGGQGGEFGGLGFRRISEGTSLTHNSISRAVKALEAADLLRVVHAPRDPATGFVGVNSYFAKFPSKSDTAVSSRSHVQVSPRYTSVKPLTKTFRMLQHTAPVRCASRVRPINLKGRNG